MRALAKHDWIMSAPLHSVSICHNAKKSRAERYEI